MRSFIEHFFVFEEVGFKLLVSAILRIDGGDVSYVPDASAVGGLEFSLVGLNLIS